MIVTLPILAAFIIFSGRSSHPMLYVYMSMYSFKDISFGGLILHMVSCMIRFYEGSKFLFLKNRVVAIHKQVLFSVW